MSVSARRMFAIGVLLPSALLAGCAVESGRRGSQGRDGSGSSSPSAGSVGGTAPAAVMAPDLVVVDPDLTMKATAGDGVGVFTEYVHGGKWHVWWTCDTNVTGFGCSFDNTLSVSAGRIVNVAGQGLQPSDRLVQPAEDSIELVTATTTSISGVTFEATPGAVLTLDAKLNGVDDGSLFFFVENGIVNGGYAGVVADPLMLEPATP